MIKELTRSFAIHSSTDIDGKYSKNELARLAHDASLYVDKSWMLCKTLAVMQNRKSDYDQIWVALAAKTPVGVIATRLSTHAHKAVDFNIFVAESHRRMGAANALLESFMNYKRQFVEPMGWSVLVHGNEEFFEKALRPRAFEHASCD